MERIVVITGGSSGIGKAIAERFAATGNIVYELSRSGKSTPHIHHITCDLTDSAQIKEAFAELARSVRRIEMCIRDRRSILPKTFYLRNTAVDILPPLQDERPQTGHCQHQCGKYPRRTKADYHWPAFYWHIRYWHPVAGLSLIHI